MTYDYDMAVIGGGAAGLTAAGMAASFGAKTVLIEARKLGGDCTWYGCIPSKTLLKAAKVAYQSRNASRYGLQDYDDPFDASSVFNHVRKTRQQVYEDADDPSIYEKIGITVIKGFARFDDKHTLIISKDGNEQKIRSRFIIIATGSRAFVPPIHGLGEVDYLTNETLFDLDEAPKQLLIIGGGPIGIEMSQAFSRLGSEVTVIEKRTHILAKDEPELTDILKQNLEKEGIRFFLETNIENVSQKDEIISVTISTGDKKETIEGDALLVAAGRQNQFSRLNLVSAGVKTNKNGIVTDIRSRTNVKNIFACGDVTSRYQFTHMADHTAKIAVINALLKLPYKSDEKHITWVTYTDPELAHVGMTQQELDSKQISYKRYRLPYQKIDRAVAENETTGWIHIYAKERSGKILGVSILGERAGDMIAEYALAMKNGVSLRKIADTIHPYPTYGLGVRRAADQWYVQRQSVGLVKIIQKIFGYKGQLPDLSDPDRIV